MLIRMRCSTHTSHHTSPSPKNVRSCFWCKCPPQVRIRSAVTAVRLPTNALCSPSQQRF